MDDDQYINIPQHYQHEVSVVEDGKVVRGLTD